MNKYITPMLIGGIAATGALATLVVVLWPPGLAAGLSLAVLGGSLAIAIAIHLVERHHYRPEWSLRPKDIAELTDAQLAEWRNRTLIEREQRLELRELQLARQMRALQLTNEDYLDILQAEPSADDLALLVETDRKLIALIEFESQQAFDRVLANRYDAERGVNSELILSDLRAFVEQVARLYRPDTEHPLLETEIERIAKSLSSTALHMLIVIDGLPLNLKSYNAAKMYRLVRRGARYYGTYKAFRPYLDHGLNLLQLTRIALGTNPAAAGAAWAAAKLTTYGARAIGERVLQRQALQLLSDVIRVIGFEAAMMYGGDFRHRDANWILGAALVNLEVARGADVNGRDEALVKICNLALRHEFDRIRLLNHLAKRRAIDVQRVSAQSVMTSQERDNAAMVLSDHCRETAVSFEDDATTDWRLSVESMLGVELNVPRSARGARPPPQGVKRFLKRLRRKA